MKEDTSDAMLIERIKKYDKKSGETLFLRYNQQIFAFIYSKHPNRDTAKDLTQQTFLKAFQNLNQLKEPEKFRSWLYMIAKNSLFQHYFKNRHKDIDFSEMEPFLYHERDGNDYFVDDLKSKFENALINLSDQQKEIVTMRIFSELKFFEIAQKMGITENHAKVAFHNGIKKLKEVWEE
ncbi:sigma-70 family RNA polymerase sigma factor [bacterium]|nr:sigma-70 family RNA polymerase sigma factor [bacterium]